MSTARSSLQPEDSRTPELVAPTMDSVPAHTDSHSGARDSSVPGWIPNQIGEYRILRLIGEGGMGAVFQAQQRNPSRLVALKVVKFNLDGDQLRRFEIEADALGRLHHPGIAQIYAAGTAETGGGPLPYFAMEYIQGTTLSQYARAQGLNLRLRLELFMKVCDAVHHAHQRGIIHRDLKPGNIMVDEGGQPKILDFGLAKMTNSDMEATRQTDVGQIMGTLPYMSPEQVMADPLELDIRTDIYSLGIILYELLADRLPYATEKKLHDAVRTILEEEPAPLSSVNRVYRGDIETIVGKALEKDKARRYASAATLGGDVSRYLRHEPIVARPPSTAYQMRKLVLRHRALFLSGALIFLVLVVGIVISTDQALRARRAERLAREQQGQAERSAAIADQQRREAEAATALAVKRQAETEAARKAAEAATRAEARQRDLAEQEAVEAKMQTALADQNFALAQNAVTQYFTQVSDSPELREHGLEPLRRQLLQTARDFFRKIAAGHSTDPRVQLEYANSFTELGNIDAEIGGHGDEAEQSFQHAIDIVRPLLAADPNNDGLFDAQLAAADGLASLYVNSAQDAKADALYARWLPLCGQRDRQHLLDRKALISWSNIEEMEGNEYLRQHKFEMGVAPYQNVLALRERLLKRFPGDEQVQVLLLHINSNFAALYGQEHRPEPGEPYARAAVEIGEQLVKLAPNNPSYQSRLASCWNNLGGILALQKKYDESRTAHEAALKIREDLLRNHPTVLSYGQDVAFSLVNLADLANNQHQPSESLPLAERAASILSGLLQQEPHNAYMRFAMRYAYYWVARDDADLNTYPAEVKAWDEAIAYDDYHDASLRAGRIIALAHAGRCVDMAAQAQELARGKSDADTEFSLARAYSICAVSTADDRAIAVAWLSKAAASGALKNADNLKLLAGHPDFASIARAPETRSLIAQNR